MSNALAIAAVTAVLKDMLDNALVDQSINTNVGGPVTVTTLPPDRIETGSQEQTQLNLFMYHVTPNLGWRNRELPSHNIRGERLTNPPLALDLYFLLSAYGRDDFEAEILLGYGMQVLHDNAVLTRGAIRAALAQPSAVDGSILPPAVGALIASDLAEQVELIKLVPQPMNTEEMSKLWTAFQASYRPSITYHASVVLIESAHATHSPLPVLTRGDPDPVSGREGGVLAFPSLILPYPAIDSAAAPNNQNSVRMGELLTLIGHHLDGDQVGARFSHVPSGDTLALTAEPGGTAASFQVRMPPDPPPGPVPDDSPMNPENWRAGVYTVVATVQQSGQEELITNHLPVILAPTIAAANAAQVGDEVIVTVTCRPPIWQRQKVSLIIGAREIAADPIATAVTDTITFAAQADNLPTGQQWLRLRVDGVDSILVDRSQKPPVFDPTQQVTIP